jgi:thiamine biosynthesis protein ThiS
MGEGRFTPYNRIAADTEMLKVQGLMAVEITLNGETRRLDAALSVRGLLESLGLDPAKIAVERNLEIVPRSAFAATPLAEGDRIEIVAFVGGG